jgi:hypothetical protein
MIQQREDARWLTRDGADMRPTFPEQHLVERIEDLIRIQVAAAAGPIRERLRALVVELVEYVPRLLDLNLLIKVELQNQSLNTTGLKRVLEAYAKAPRIPDIEAIFFAAGNNPADWVPRLRQNLQELESEDLPQDALTRFASLTLILSKRFSDLQLGTTVTGPHVDVLEAELRKAIALWSDESVLLQLQECRAEFSTLPSMMAFPDSLAPPQLFAAAGVEEARGAIVSYIARSRPVIVQQWLREQGEQWPDRAPSLASIIGQSRDSELAPLPRVPTRAERDAFEAVLRIVSLAMQVWPQVDEELQLALGVKRRLRNLRTVSDWVVRWQKNKGADFVNLLLFEMKALSRALGVWGQSTGIDAVLRGYKLRNEVACHPPHPELDDSLHELRFQKHVCAYLLDNGIPSFGTKFGRLETDLIVDMHRGDEGFVIEAKKIKSLSSVAQAIAAINQGFIQLKKYMNDTPTVRRGVLLVFSFAPIVVTYPHEWIRHQFRVVVVDLANLPPSKRSSSLSLAEGSVSSGSELLAVDTTPAKKRTTGKSSKRGRRS